MSRLPRLSRDLERRRVFRVGASSAVRRSVSLLLRDLRRILPGRGKGRVAAAFAVLSLALGVAGNAVFFTWVNALVFEPLPYQEPDRLVILGESQKGRRTLAMISMYTALPTWDDFRRRSRTLEDWSAFLYRLRGLSRGDRSVSVMVGHGTAGLFRTLGVEPARGRLFLEDDGVEGAPGVAVAAWDFWQAQGGPESGLLGATVRLDGEPHRVVGILPEDFELLVGKVGLWTPLRRDPATWPRDSRGVISVARMAHGTGMAGVRAEVASISAELEVEHPEELSGWEMRAYHMATEFPDPQSRMHMALVQGIMVFVLLIACANVAIILLARGEERRREMALRSALGAGRGRIVRLHLRESLVMAAVGGALGIALALVGFHLLSGLLADTVLPRALLPRLDGTVLLFTLAIVALTGLSFGLAPALQSLRQDHAETLKSGTGHGASGGGGRRWLTSALVSGEIALCLVALGGGSIMLRGFESVRQPDPGFEPDGLLVVEFAIPPWKHAEPGAWLRLIDAMEEELGSLAGVRSVGLVSQPPQTLMMASADTFRVPGRATGSGAEETRPRAQLVWATPGYRETLGMPLLAGRFFDGRDGTGDPPVAVVSGALAARHLAGADPVGRRIEVRGVSREIVGVVGDVQQTVVPQPEGTTDGAIYIPRAQQAGNYGFLVARTTGDPRTLAEPARRAVAAVDPDIVVHAVERQRDYARRFTAPLDVTVQLVRLFGLFGLLLASLGTYGVVSHVVAGRTHELGVRMAVGARPAEVVALVARHGIVMALAGLALGTLILIPVASVAGSVLEGFARSTVEPVTLVGTGVLLLLVTLVACIGPALRAARVDPSALLRAE